MLDVEMLSVFVFVVFDVFVGVNMLKVLFKFVVFIIKDFNELIWFKVLKRVNDVDESVVVEVMKSVCYEIVRVKEDVVAYVVMVGDIDGLVYFLVKCIEYVFVIVIVLLVKGMCVCRYILNVLM